MKTKKTNNLLPAELFARRFDLEGLAMAGLFAAYVGMCACCVFINRQAPTAAKSKSAQTTNALAGVQPAAPTNTTAAPAKTS